MLTQPRETRVSCKSPQSGGVLEANERAGTRLELLLFRLTGQQLFGINVFKVQEVIPCQPITAVPGSHPLVKGIATLRGVTMPIIDLSEAIGGLPLADPENGKIIITEYNRSVHGFLVGSVERIIHTQWEAVQPRPKGSGRQSYTTAVTLVDDEMISILDVEKVLDEVVHASTRVSEELISRRDGVPRRVFVVDDSSTARKQVTNALEQLGIECTTAADGKKALEQLERMLADGVDVASEFLMIISDIEMPEMDGYMLTSAVRTHPKLGEIYILLHSSISGEFNIKMVEKTGANRFIQKYSADDLAQAVLHRIDELNSAEGDLE
ncbi:MAG: chemotaxis protein CheV [Gammaproteobacteria bacterium]